MQAPVILSGTSNQPLATSVARLLKKTTGQIEITRFMDGECRVWVKEDVRDKHVFVFQSLSMVADQFLVELCLIGQALKQQKAKKITVIIPWMGYSKQDKEFRKGEAVSISLVSKFIEAAGFDNVITIELHSETIVPYFHIPVKEISTHDLFAREFLSKEKKENMVVVSPDMGGKARSERFARSVGLPIVYIDKKRNKETGDVKVLGVSESVDNRDVIIYDDIINTGATVIKTSEFLKNNGARSVHFLATHAVLAGPAVERLQASPLDDVIVTDTILIPKEKQFKNLSVISVAPIIASDIMTS